MMSEGNRETLLYDYMHERTDLYAKLLPGNLERSLLSETNWIIRSRYASGEDMGIKVVPGDICYMDFGQMYLNEMGFQHFGLAISICQKKALVIPMTSNIATYAKAYDEICNPSGKKNLMRIGLVKGLNKPSVLFLNDVRFVNTARVIDIKAHLDIDGEMYGKIRSRFLQIAFPA